MALVVDPVPLEYDGYHCCEGLYQHKLEYPLLDPAEEYSTLSYICLHLTYQSVVALVRQEAMVA